jgi:hypothetical protein
MLEETGRSDFAVNVTSPAANRVMRITGASAVEDALVRGIDDFGKVGGVDARAASTVAAM